VKFLVVIPTIRQSYPGFDAVIARIEGTFTQPTDFQVLDGKGGKTQTLNRCLEETLSAGGAEVYVTMDDDIVPTPGWQDRIVETFEKLPRYGALGLWLGDSPDMSEYMGAHLIEHPFEQDGLTVRRVKPGHHIVGCLVAMRRQVAIDVGPTPTPTEKYQFWEDGWRGRRVTKLGFEQGFVDAGPVEIVPWQDTAEYLSMKQNDIAESREKVDDYMRQGGVRDPLAVRLRRKVSRLLGRS